MNDLNEARRQYLDGSNDSGGGNRRQNDSNSANKNVTGGLMIGMSSLAAMAMKKTKV